MLLLSLAALASFQPQQYSDVVLSCQGPISSVAFITSIQGSDNQAKMKLVDVAGGSKLIVDLNSGVVKSERIEGMDSHAFDLAVTRRTDADHAIVDFAKAQCDGIETKATRLTASKAP